MGREQTAVTASTFSCCFHSGLILCQINPIHTLQSYARKNHCNILAPPPQMYAKYLLLDWRYNSGRVLAFSTISFHLRRSWTCSVHFMSFIFFRSFLTSSSHRDFGLPTGLPVNGFHLCIFFTILVSDVLFMCPNHLNLWTLT